MTIGMKFKLSVWIGLIKKYILFEGSASKSWTAIATVGTLLKE